MNKVEKMEQVLDAALSVLTKVSCSAYTVEDTIEKIKAARSMPKRNCDVGTAEEQAERFGRYCDKFTQDGLHCETCPCCVKITFGRCEFAWLQMPYEEGGAK